MIDVRLAEVSSGTEWAQVIAQCNGNAMHLPAIHLVDHEARDLRPLRFEVQGELVACALGIEVQERRVLGLLRGPSHLELPTAPALARPELAGEVRAALFAYAREQRHDRIVIHPTYSDWLVTDEDLAPYRTTSITEFVIDLRGGAEAVSAAMHKQHRKNVRRAAKSELVIEQDDGPEGLRCLRDLQLSSSERASERANGFGVRDTGFFERLHGQIYGPGHGHVIFARLGDERVAALAWIEAAERVLTVRSGSLPEGYECRAMYLLYDELIRRSIGAGMCELNAGGVPMEAASADHPQNGLHEFKNGFGGRPTVRHGLDVLLGEVPA